MARMRVALPAAATIRALIDADGKLAVRVTPGARVETIEVVEGKLFAKVRAKPQDGAANAAVVKLLSSTLGIAPSRVELLRGATSREKLFRIVA